MARTRLLAALAGVVAGALLVGGGAVAAAPPAARGGTDNVPIQYQRWQSYRDWRTGTAAGAVTVPGRQPGVVIGRPAGTTEYTDPHTGATSTWEYATWTSPVHRLGFGATELVASWNAATPAGTWLQVELLGTYSTGQQTPWFVMGRWAASDVDVKRTTVNRQGDPYSTIWTDTFSIDDPDAGVLLTEYQLRLTLYRKPGLRTSPFVWQLGAMSSAVPDRFGVQPSRGGTAWGVELAVPRHSQSIHRNEYPEYGGGGQVWCSPTSTTMVLEYWGLGPSEQDMAWIRPGYIDPQVAHAARMTWDYAYEGAGNWPFNTAYAASFGAPGRMDGIITRLRSLDELELFIKAGIPVITSQSFEEHELDGAGYGTSGHIFVVVGFTADGDVIVNDPASPSNDAVRHVYQREQFETIWLRTKRERSNGTIGSGSGGIAYLIKPEHKPWPRTLDHRFRNW